jgi:ParB family chromosome partitioning protein
MSKQADIMNRFGANLAESMGAGRVARPVAGLHGASSASTPSRHDGAGRLKSGAEIAIDRIAPDPNQPRTEFDPDSIARLAESLKSHGQIQPITVRWSDEMGRYLIVSGERRWRAAAIAGRPTLSTVILDGEPDESRILEIQLIENCLREDLAPIERARAFKTLMDRNGWNGARLADVLHIDPSSVTRALALLELPCTVQEAVESGELSPSVAYEIGKAPTAEVQAEVAALAVAEGLSRAEVVEAVRAKASQSSARAVKGRGGSKPKRTIATIRTSAGKLTLENRRGVDDATFRAAILEALAQIDARDESRGEAA